MNFPERLQKIIDEDVLIECIKNEAKVPGLLVRQIAAEVGVSLPNIYHKLYELGHAAPIIDFRKGLDKLPKIVAAISATFKPFCILFSKIMERCRELYNYEEPAKVKRHIHPLSPKQTHSTTIITAEEKKELNNWCAEAPLGVAFNEAAIQAQQLELIRSSKITGS